MHTVLPSESHHAVGRLVLVIQAEGFPQATFSPNKVRFYNMR